MDYPAALGIPSPDELRVSQLLAPATSGGGKPAYVAPLPEQQAFSDYAQTLTAPAAPPPVEAPVAILPSAYHRGLGAAASWRQAQQQAQMTAAAKDTIAKLSALDPADPDHLTHQEQILAANPMGGQILHDPAVAGLVRSYAKQHAEAQHFFDADPQAQYDYAHMRQNGMASAQAHEAMKRGARYRQDRTKYAAMGGDPDELAQYVDPTSGVVDMAKAVHAFAQGEGDVLKPAPHTWDAEVGKLEKQYRALASDPTLITDGEKEAYINANKLQKDQKGWQTAFNAIQEQRLAPIKTELAAKIKEAEDARYLPRNDVRQLIGLPPIPVTQKGGKNRIDRAALERPAPTAVGPSSMEPKQIHSQGEYDALPSGAKYMDSNGKIATKR